MTFNEAAADMGETRKDRTITRQDLAAAVTRSVGLPRAEATEVVGQVLETISESLLRGEPVLLSGFGKFVVVPRAARRARNVRAGHDVMVGPRLAIVYKPAIGLVQHLTDLAKAGASEGRSRAASGGSPA